MASGETGLIMEGNKVFNNVVAAKEFMLEYNKANFTKFVVNTNNSKALVYKCAHGVQRKSSCRGGRPRQHYNYLECKALIRMYKYKDGRVMVTMCNLQHNHTIDSATHNLNSEELNDSERDLVLTLKQANAKTSQT